MSFFFDFDFELPMDCERDCIFDFDFEVIFELDLLTASGVRA